MGAPGAERHEQTRIVPHVDRVTVPGHIHRHACDPPIRTKFRIIRQLKHDIVLERTRWLIPTARHERPATAADANERPRFQQRSSYSIDRSAHVRSQGSESRTIIGVASVCAGMLPDASRCDGCTTSMPTDGSSARALKRECRPPHPHRSSVHRPLRGGSQ